MVTFLLSKVAQPGQPGVSGLGDGARDIEMEDRLGTSPYFGQPPPPRIAAAGVAIANKVYVGVVLVRGPVALKVVEEQLPVGRQAMGVEVLPRKRKAVVDADQQVPTLAKPLD